MRFAKCFNLLKFTALAYHICGKVIAGDDNLENFGQMYKWKNLREGFQEAKTCQKPIFFLIYKPGCPTCEKLKPKFTNSIRILDLSKNFVMVNMKKDEIPRQEAARLQPDGTYVPRILFFTPDGEFMEDIYNRHPKADNKYKYFYSNTSQIIDSMIMVLERYSNNSLLKVFEDKSKKVKK